MKMLRTSMHDNAVMSETMKTLYFLQIWLLGSLMIQAAPKVAHGKIDRRKQIYYGWLSFISKRYLYFTKFRSRAHTPLVIWVLGFRRRIYKIHSYNYGKYQFLNMYTNLQQKSFIVLWSLWLQSSMFHKLIESNQIMCFWLEWYNYVYDTGHSSMVNFTRVNIYVWKWRTRSWFEIAQYIVLYC